jgi:hypothetical protein
MRYSDCPTVEVDIYIDAAPARVWALMRTAVMLSAEAAPWDQLVSDVVEAEKLGADARWVAEACGKNYKQRVARS